jgi:hypothetical protein
MILSYCCRFAVDVVALSFAVVAAVLLIDSCASAFQGKVTKIHNFYTNSASWFRRACMIDFLLIDS